MYSSAYVWAKVLSHMEERLGAVTVSAWFDDAEVVELNENNLILYSPSDFRRDIIRRRCTGFVEDALKEVFNSDAKLLVFGDKERDSFRNKGKTVSSMDFNPQFTFDNFVVGPSNRFAHSASIAVSKNPGQVYNPLFIYGPSGVGKTHLLYAIANGIRRQNPEANIVYIKGDEFTNELISAIASGKNVEFRSKYRESDLFLIDDIQFIIGKDSTQIEFFNTFEALYQSGKQLVISSDKPPSQMEHLDMRYRSRFTSGMTIDIQPPDYEMSMAILRNKQENSDIQLNEEILDYIATNIKSNIRILEGAYNKILLFARFTKPKDNKIDLNMAKEALKDFISPNENMVITADYIIDIVADHFNLDKEAILSEKRTKTVSIPRQICMYLCNELTNLTLTEIAVKLKRSNHSTVIHGVHKIEQDILVDKELEETINVLKKKLNS